MNQQSLKKCYYVTPLPPTPFAPSFSLPLNRRKRMTPQKQKTM